MYFQVIKEWNNHVTFTSQIYIVLLDSEHNIKKISWTLLITSKNNFHFICNSIPTPFSIIGLHPLLSIPFHFSFSFLSLHLFAL